MTAAEIAVFGVVALHFAVTLFPFLGAFLILRWPWFVRVHVPILLWAFSIPFLQYPCPLTDLENRLRAGAGMPRYDTHFIEHYIYRPLAPYGHLIWDNFNWMAPSLAYALYFRQRRRARHQARIGTGPRDLFRTDDDGRE